jgi:hypothetical protein
MPRPTAGGASGPGYPAASLRLALEPAGQQVASAASRRLGLGAVGAVGAARTRRLAVAPGRFGCAREFPLRWWGAVAPQYPPRQPPLKGTGQKERELLLPAGVGPAATECRPGPL